MPVIRRALPRISSSSPRTGPTIVLLSRTRHLSISSSAAASSSSSSRDSNFRRSDFYNQGYSAPIDPNPPVVGPIALSSKLGAPRLTPSLLKGHLDKFVVGQDKAKKVTSVAIFNHYQRIRELRRQDTEEVERQAQRDRRLLKDRERNSHPVESKASIRSPDSFRRPNIEHIDEFPGHVETVDLNYRPIGLELQADLGSAPIVVSAETIIEKSNLLLLGPSGVGKTYIVSTIARVLEVPFATVDCSSLTQAGYIGTDIESAIERLLLASDYNISRCESGIIFFDEIDKLAKPAVMTHGRDVSGEGVQQGLLKMIEGTNVTVNAKSDKNSKSEAGSRGSDRLGRDSGQPGKSEQYTVDTSNILFVFAGAFVGLDKIISTRLSAGTSIGFGAQLKKDGSIQRKDGVEIHEVNLLAHVTPTDLQTYGLIPELLGRIPVLTALQPLTLPQLVSILTEPKNSLVKQYTALFSTYNIELRFTTRALRAIAERALDLNPSKDNKKSIGGGIGARGLRSIMEAVLGEIMYWGPGSGIRYCLVDEKFVRGLDEGSSQFQTRKMGNVDPEKEGKSLMPRCFSRGQGHLFEEAYETEEEGGRRKAEPAGTFEQYREVGSSGM